tara:strand:- start:848 stop:1333 length:486 start_codon:yes stop_codon:yes gene_type:complete
MSRERNYELEQLLNSVFRYADCKGGGGPRIDYAAIQRQQDQERQRLQGIADEKYRMQGVSDFIDYMYDSPEQSRHQSAAGRYFTGVSPGAIPNKVLANYQTDKSITAKALKANPTQFFDRRTSEASIKPGRIKFGKTADKSADASGLLGSGGQDQKTLLGA